MSARVFCRSISIALRSISATFLLVGAAFAAEPVTADPVDFQISEQPLNSALNEFARQSDREIFYASDVVDGIYVNSVDGKYEPEDALELLLADSGLEYSVTASDTFLVNDQGGDSEQKNLGIAPVLMAQNVSQTTTNTETSSRSENGGTSIVTGKVTDARTGANLKGAKVTIEETGQWTSTNDLGEFRLVNVPTGSATLTVSYLGYAGQSAIVGVHDDAVSQSFELRGGSEIEEIIVFGQRSARALALNMERTAENSTTVLSADLLGQFEGATLAEALRRAPGIAFQEDPLTGDGTNVIIRGLSPDFNQIRLDGQRLAEGSGTGRSPAIGNLLAGSIDEVVISKTLLPSQDSNGAGGLIEITTKGPLDRKRRFAQFAVEFGTNDGFEDNQQYSGILSGTFGDSDQFGLSLSLQHREESKETVGYSYQIDAFGQYLPLGADGNPVTSTFFLDPRLSFPYEPGVDNVYPRSVVSSINNVDPETLAGTLTAEWHPFENTDWRLSYTRTEQEVDSIGGTLAFNQDSIYRLLPVDELGGEIRGVYVWEDSSGEDQPNFPINSSSGMRANFATNTTDVLSFQGETFVNQWTANYRLSRSEGTSENIGYRFGYRLVDIDSFFFNLPSEFISPGLETIDGRLVSLFAPRLPGDNSYVLPRLNEAGFAFFNNPANFGFTTSDRIRLSTSGGENVRDSALFSLRRDFLSNNFRYFELGVEYEQSRFDTSLPPPRADYLPISGLTLADLGISSFEGDVLSSVGIDTGFQSVTDDDFRRLIEQLDALSSGSNPLFNRADLPTSAFFNEGTFTDEEELAIYLQGRLDIGDFEIIGGVRYSEVDVSARFFATPALTREDGSFDFDFFESNRTLVDQSASQSVYLPRLAINYRPSDNFVIRGGYFQTFSRPRVQDLSSRQIARLDLRQRFGAGGDQPRLSITQGNPDLEPAITHSYDLSIELYDDNAGVIELSLFYKDIENFIEFNSQAITDDIESIALPDVPELQNLPDNIFVEIRQPINNDNPAEIYGAEINVERQFVKLPGAWGGLGVFANYTYSDSEKFFRFDNFFDPVSGEFIDIEVSGVPFDQSPKHSGTLAVTYNKYGIDASIAYTAQSERQQGFGPAGLSEFDDKDDTLDLRFEYQLDAWNGTWRFFVAGSDLLKGTEDPDTLTYIGDSNKYYTDGTYFGGRTFSAGISAVF